MNNAERQKTYIELINRTLDEYLPERDNVQGTIYKAMRYSLLAGGKRLRPVMCLEFCRMCGGDYKNALPFACAIEMIHTYSLIHDDLPCMDNDDYRRGRLTNHKVFGEAAAVLAGDALLNYAFETVFEHLGDIDAPYETVLRALRVMANASGTEGMIGGQVIDMESENRQIDIETLKTLQRLKTGAMFKSAVMTGAIIGGGSDELVKAAGDYAGYLGLAFQIEDDILDVVGDQETLGKPIGSDAESGKSTFVTHLGIEGARAQVGELTEKAIECLAPFEDSSMIEEMSRALVGRRS